MKKIQFHILTLFILLISLAVGVFGGTVVLDTTFNGIGYRLQTVNSEGSQGTSLAIQPDGKIFLGGWVYVSGLTDYMALKFNPNGTFDTSFDTDGIATTNLGPVDLAKTIRIQADGKILLGGNRFGSAGTNDDFGFVRYNTNGTLDNSFDANGIFAPNINGFSAENLYDMTLQPDGNIVAVGTTAPTTMPDQNLPTDLAIMRITPAGTLDTTFNGTGILVVRFNDVNEAANAVVIQPDGKIVIGGFLNNFVKNDYLMMRFEANGMIDTTFGSGGLVITSINSSNNNIRSLALQNDGKILAGGTNAMVRYRTDGSLDESFGNNGIVNTTLQVTKLLLLNDGKILITGSSGSNPAVSRYNSNGTLDTSFNGTGTATANLANNTCLGNSLAVQSDNKIVVGGSCSPGTPKSFVFRFQELRAKGYLDFDGDAKTDIGIFRSSVGEWWINRSSTLQTVAAQFGQSTDKPVPADFSGDGKTDIAVWRSSTGEWFVLRSDDSSFYSFPFGTSGDVPLVGDFDADGKADAGVFRPSTNEWFISKSSGGTIITTFGIAGDVPVTADYDGDGRSDIAIYRPSVGQWWIQRSSNLSVVAAAFGTSTDKPVQGDYSGDGKADIAFFRPSTGQWFILRSEDGSFYSVPFGTSGDLPVPGDYDGDGKFDTAVFRPSSNTWYINRTTAGLLITNFGIAGDQPIPNVFVP